MRPSPPRARPSAAALAPCLLLAACGAQRPPATIDLVPPVLASVSPSGLEVPVDASFTLTFSEPIKRASLFWPLEAGEAPDSVALAAAEDEDDVVAATDTPPLSDTQRKKVVACAVKLSADALRVTVTPLVPLDGNRAYLLAVSRKVSDLANNKLVTPETKANETQVVRFTTAPAPDTTAPTVRLKAPAAGAAGVAVDTATLDVEFSEAMDTASWTRDSISLREVETQRRITPVRGQWAGNVLTLDLPDSGVEGCATFCPGDRYVLEASEALADLAGNVLAPPDAATQAFTAATCVDDAAPRLVPASVKAAPSDRGVTVTWLTDEPSTSIVEFLACGAGACPAPVTGPPAVCTQDICALPEDEASFQCAHAVKVTGLSPSTDYALVVVSKDGGGREARSARLDFRTLEPLPRLVINELFATPKGFTSSTGASDPDQGKFVELYNAGAATVDFTPACDCTASPVDAACTGPCKNGPQAGELGWALARCADPTCTPPFSNTWYLKPAAGGSLAPGGFAVAHGAKFDAARMGVPGAAVRLVNNGSTSTVMNRGLTSTTAYAYALLSPAGVVVSTYGAHLGVPSRASNDGRSFERRDPQGDDAANNWSVSTAAVAGATGNFATPGSPNAGAPPPP